VERELAEKDWEGATAGVAEGGGAPAKSAKSERGCYSACFEPWFVVEELYLTGVGDRCRCG